MIKPTKPIYDEYAHKTAFLPLKCLHRDYSATLGKDQEIWLNVWSPLNFKLMKSHESALGIIIFIEFMRSVVHNTS